MAASPGARTTPQLELELLRHVRGWPAGGELAGELAARSELWKALTVGNMPERRDIWSQPGVPPETLWTPDCLRHVRSLAFGAYEARRLWMLPQRGAEASLSRLVEGFGAKALPVSEHILGFELAGDRISGPLPQPAEIARERSQGPQAVALELLRRTTWNDLSGERVAADLEAHGDVWCAAWAGISNTIVVHEGPPTLVVRFEGESDADVAARTAAAPARSESPSPSRFYSLLEQTKNEYVADQLWVVCRNRDAARTLISNARRGWKASSKRLWNRANSRNTAGCVDDERVVSFWWD